MLGVGLEQPIVVGSEGGELGNGEAGTGCGQERKGGKHGMFLLN